MPYRYRSDEVDLDSTIEILAERPRPEDTDIVVRERTGARRAVALIVDVSGSMGDEKVRVAAATVAALSADLSLARDEFTLVAFWSDAAVLKPMTVREPPNSLLDKLLRIPARGLTNVAFGLCVAHAELARSNARRRSAILLTDAVHNAGELSVWWKPTASTTCRWSIGTGRRGRPLATSRLASRAEYQMPRRRHSLSRRGVPARGGPPARPAPPRNRGSPAIA
ncbi:MAG TPA: vWA domain-containing protein [Amycolatopsis sp.]|nr:vWA domain-containing protein [Amycolatopsis sp.]